MILAIVLSMLYQKMLLAIVKILFLFRYTMERPRFSDHLEAIKFICKDFWSELFKKQIDNLKTNHRVSSNILTDYNYMFLCEFKKMDFFYFFGRVRLSCKIIDFVGLHVCQLIHLLKMEIYLKIILRLKTRQHKLLACIYISHVES